MAASVAQTVNTTERLARLRDLMNSKENDVNAYVVPSEDQHSSEYLADCDARRAFISGFNGSAGCAIITLKEALLFTDGRYFLQAEKQLDANWTLMKQGLPDVPTWQQYLAKHLDGDARIGIDPSIIAIQDANSLKDSLEQKGSKLVPLRTNLVDEVWGDKRPARPKNKVFTLDVKYTGKSHKEKIKEIRETMIKKQAGALVVNMLDEVAWLLNLRGSDIAFNPVFFAYAVITADTTIVFIDENQLGKEARERLSGDVEIRPYESVFKYLDDLVTSDSWNGKSEKKVLLGTKASLALADAIGDEHLIIERSAITDAKALKNEIEVEGFRQCHIRDGSALARYFAWLEEQLNDGVELNETEAADQLEQYRSQLDLFMGLSFPTISATGPNGSIIHYTPERADCAIIRKDQMYLCDSGGQYKDGTTDVTRTWHFGTPTKEEKNAFTRVLQGHIAIDTAVFPEGTSGYILDAFARRYLWKDGLDYRHGTGHGVGHFLNVHEGPQGIGTRPAYNETHLKKGMTLSNEPGFYADGRFGIRLENVCVVTGAKTPNNFGDRGYLTFEHLTMCPFQTKLVELSLLTSEERNWLNSYNAEVLGKVKPLLKDDKRATLWLERECMPL